MLDVHPPHHPTHTWRDFFLHIATICVGLLIAIGLEQTVEYFHHRSQARHLEEDLRAEAELNIRIIDSSLAIRDPASKWTASIVLAARTASERNGFVSFTIPALPPLPPSFDGGTYSVVPSHGVWTVATAEGLVNLLSPQKAQIYNRLEFEAAEAIRIQGISDVSRLESDAVLRGLGVSMEPGKSVHLSSAQRDEFVRAIGKVLELDVWYTVRLALWKGASEAIVYKVPTMADMFPYLNRESDKVKEP